DELSGGQQQRVAIARSMATQPQLILMDESFSALDPVLRTQQQDLLLKLHRQSKTTVVFVTHDMQEALRLGDRIAVINDGQLQQVGTPNEILERPANQFVADFFATARPRLGTMTALLSSKLVQKTPVADQSAVVTTVAELASLTPDTTGWLCFQYQGQGFRIQTTDLLHYLGQREER
ncbi:MAG: ATP-binding cassette domain-containing protein, partial [Limosilactobacillus mucosae]|nr:ATP-binding cassette domain-containing protein [Limosilactobacillus mucosae]